jgi:ABC-type Fe3+ transport system permease subunit
MSLLPIASDGYKSGMKWFCVEPAAEIPSISKWLTSARYGLLLWAVPVLFLALFFFYPLGAIFRLAIETAVREGLSPTVWARIWRPLGFTFYQAGLSTLLTLIVGLPAAYVFARFNFPGKEALRVFTTIPFILAYRGGGSWF